MNFARSGSPFFDRALLYQTITDQVTYAYHSPAIWFLGPVLLAAALARAHFNEAEKQVVRLWQLVGFSGAVYSLPPLSADATHTRKKC